MRTRVQRKKGIGAVNFAGIVVAASLFGYSLPAVSVPVQAMYSLAAASASLSVGVAPNPDNTLAQQLDAKAAQLDVQQQHIQQLQQSLRSSSNDTLGLYSLLASVLLLLLIAANFYLDWRRDRGGGGMLTKSLSVDLRTLWQK